MLNLGLNVALPNMSNSRTKVSSDHPVKSTTLSSNNNNKQVTERINVILQKILVLSTISVISTARVRNIHGYSF